MKVDIFSNFAVGDTKMKNKKKMIIPLIIILTMVLICLTLFLWNQNYGKTNNAVITIGKSTKFSKEEIQSAENCVIKKFKDFKGCELTRLWYDEKRSNSFAEGYISDGKGSVIGVKTENVIVLLSDFNVDSKGGGGGFNPNSTYNYWNWILIRNSKTGNWKVEDWGY